MSKTKTIRASMKVSPKIRDTYYSLEYMEEREIQDGDNLEEEKKNLWDDVYNTVIDQINEIVENH